MPGAWAVVAKLGLVLAILTVVVLTVRRIFRRIEERQAFKDQIAQLETNLARSEAARRKEQEIADAARTVRDGSGPRVPTADELRQPPGGPSPPA